MRGHTVEVRDVVDNLLEEKPLREKVATVKASRRTIFEA